MLERGEREILLWARLGALLTHSEKSSVDLNFLLASVPSHRAIAVDSAVGMEISLEIGLDEVRDGEKRGKKENCDAGEHKDGVEKKTDRFSFLSIHVQLRGL